MEKPRSTKAGVVSDAAAAEPPEARATAIHGLVARCQDGDQTAFRQIFDEYVSGVHRHLGCLLGPESDIDDLVQLVFLHAFSAIDSFKGESSFATWLFRITINVAHQEIRVRRRRRRLDSALADAGYIRAGATARTPEFQLHLHQQLYEILDQLPEKKRETYILYMYEGYSLDEIADLLSISVSTVGSRLQSARRDIVKLLARRLR